MKLWKIMLLINALLWLAATSTPAADAVVIHLTSDTGTPLSGKQVRLTLYDVNVWPVAVGWKGQCETNAQGMCEIPVPANAPRDPSGFLRGRVEVKGLQGARPVLWPGGRLEVSLWLQPNGNRLDVPGHPPFDNETPAPVSQSEQQQRPGWPYFVIALVPLLFAGLLWWRGRKS